MPSASSATAPVASGANVRRRPRRRGRSGASLTRSSSKLPRVDVIFNPVSGHGDKSSESAAIRCALEKGFHCVRVHETTLELDAASLAEAAIRDGAQIIVASGGDGTVTAVAAACRRHAHGKWISSAGKGTGAEEVRVAASGSSGELADGVERTSAGSGSGSRSGPDSDAGAGVDAVRLGIIPRGTANAFCAALGIPSRVSRAARLVNRATVRRVDVAMVNGVSPMMLLCGIGLEAEVVARADRRLKTRFGVGAYFVAGLAAVAAQKRFAVTLILHDARQVQRGGGELFCKEVVLRGRDVTAVTVANSAPATSVLAQGVGLVRPDDGLLDVVCVAPQGRLGMVSAMLAMLWSGLVGSRVVRGDVYGLKARRVEVDCVPPQKVVVDGEDCGFTPVVIELAENEGRRQISVIAPKAGTVSRRRRRLGRALVRAIRNLRGVLGLGLAVWGARRLRGEIKGGRFPS